MAELIPSRRAFLLAAPALTLVGRAGVQGAAWPERPVRVILP